MITTFFQDRPLNVGVSDVTSKNIFYVQSMEKRGPTRHYLASARQEERDMRAGSAPRDCRVSWSFARPSIILRLGGFESNDVTWTPSHDC